MGTFDEFQFISDDALQVTCASGHPQRGGLQTKDLDSTMSRFNVYGGLAFVEPHSESPLAVSRSTYKVQDGVLFETSVSVSILATHLDGEVSMYTTCNECAPVFYEHSSGFFGDLASKSPWCQWIVTFNSGRVVSIRSDRCETREEVRTKLAEIGAIAIPDDDRVVQRELAKWREQHPTLQA